MPNYTYECRTCGAREVEGRMIDFRNLPMKCPCGGTMVRVPDAPAFHLVGFGFHKNDYPAKDK